MEFRIPESKREAVESGHQISYKTTCAPSEGSHQLAYPRSLIRDFAGHSESSQESNASSGRLISESLLGSQAILLESMVLNNQ